MLISRNLSLPSLSFVTLFLGFAGCFTDVKRLDANVEQGEASTPDVRADANVQQGETSTSDVNRAETFDLPVSSTGGSGGFQGSGGGTTVDANSGSGGAGGLLGSGGNTTTGGIIGSGGTGTVIDAPIDQKQPSPVGAQCLVNSDCALGNCIDGVCCATTCTGCNACASTLTGKAEGTCASVLSGQDPHNTCADETAGNQCGNDGMCDGAGACRKVSASHICAPSSCSGSTFTPSSTCDGLGTCKAATPENCGAFQCAASGCLKTCSSQSDCGTANYCKITTGTTGTCTAKNPNGTPATQNYECTSNIVADGVCCAQACTGCNACSGTPLTGGAAGQCLPVLAGQVAHNACVASGTICGLDGKCDGAGACRYSPAEGASCDDTSNLCVTGRVCQNHVCTPGNTKTCNSPPPCKQSTTCVAGQCNYTQDVPDGTKDTKCPNGTQYCYLGNCVQCSSDTHCTNTKPSCDLATHTCGCRKPSVGVNLLTNPGFDGSLYGWDTLGTVSLSADSDGCIGSNSIYMGAGGDSRDPRQCILITNAGTYYFGGKFKEGRSDGNNVVIDFYGSAGCSTDWINSWTYPISQTADWSLRWGTFSTPPGTVSALVGVIAQSQYLDQLYVSSTNQF
jgi:hypothetical protein